METSLSDPSSLPSHPRHIGRYRIGRTLGKGHTCTVYHGTDLTSGEEWAVKVVDKATVTTAIAKEQLGSEILAMRALRHRHVLRMQEAIQSRTTYTFVLELAKGDLSTRITTASASRLSEPEARRYFQQMMLGVRHCHSLGIAHRDLKPENLLLDESDCLKISDFGLASLQRPAGEAERLSRGVCGTPHYMAPEVLRNDVYDGTLADIWSCGVILYVMVTGRFPFDGETRDELFRDIVRCAVVFPRRLSDSLKELLGQLLVADPRRRANLGRIFAHPWFQVGFVDEVEETAAGRWGDIDGSASPSTSSWGGMDRVPSPFPSDTVSVASSGISRAAADIPSLDAFEVIECMLVAHAKLAVVGPVAGGGVPGSKFLARASLEQLHAVLQDLGYQPQLNRSESSIKGLFKGASGPVTYMVKATPTMNLSLSFVEVLRGRGEASDFARLVQQLRQSAQTESKCLAVQPPAAPAGSCLAS